MHTYNLSNQEVETGLSEVSSGHFWPPSKFEAGLGYMRLCLRVGIGGWDGGGLSFLSINLKFNVLFSLPLTGFIFPKVL